MKSKNDPPFLAANVKAGVLAKVITKEVIKLELIKGLGNIRGINN